MILYELEPMCSKRDMEECKGERKNDLREIRRNAMRDRFPRGLGGNLIGTFGENMSRQVFSCGLQLNHGYHHSTPTNYGQSATLELLVVRRPSIQTPSVKTMTEPKIHFPPFHLQICLVFEQSG